jgi:ADP-L-glycero-D-manno-heptose 6-epimerase
MMYYVVTGAAGFVGSRLVAALNRHGVSDIIAVDNLAHADKFRNLAGCEIADYVDQGNFLARLETLEGAVEAVLHQGACSDTMESDGRYMMDNNYAYSRSLLHWCQDEEVPLLYASSASVYGAGPEFREERACEAPLNIYGYSKFLFDQYVRKVLPKRTSQVAGFRYFNVYGPNEQHKGRMASVAFHAYQQLLSAGKVKLFVGSDGYGDGEQRRDFVHVDDVVDVNLWFLEHRDVSGVYNCGTGRAQSFNQLAAAVINAVQGTQWSVRELVAKGLIEYIPFPPQLVGKYQSFTQADLTRLRTAGYIAEFMSVEQGASAYVKELQKT